MQIKRKLNAHIGAPSIETQIIASVLKSFCEQDQGDRFLITTENYKAFFRGYVNNGSSGICYSGSQVLPDWLVTSIRSHKISILSQPSALGTVEDILFSSRRIKRVENRSVRLIQLLEEVKPTVHLSVVSQLKYLERVSLSTEVSERMIEKVSPWTRFVEAITRANPGLPIVVWNLTNSRATILAFLLTLLDANDAECIKLAREIVLRELSKAPNLGRPITNLPFQQIEYLDWLFEEDMISLAKLTNVTVMSELNVPEEFFLV